MLDSLGFEGVRCSLPGRVAPAKSVSWAGAELDTHHANAVFRLTPGDLKLIEMPLSVDTSKLLMSKSGVSHYADLRADTDWRAAYGITLTDTARNIVSQVAARNPAFAVINLVVHNDEEYWKEGGLARANLIESIEGVAAACKEKGIEMTPATLADVVEQGKTVLTREAPRATLAHGMY